MAVSRPLQAASGLLSYFARHRTAANLLLVLLIALGVAAAPRMRAQFFPDVVLESIIVSVVWEGAGAEDVDAGIVALIEPVLLGVEGVIDTDSTSREGRANLDMEFEPGWDMSRALDEVQAAIDTITEFPEEAEEPVIRRRAWRDRVTDVIITGPVPVEQLGRFADELVTRLYAAGVTRTGISGVAAPETVIEVPEAALVEHGVSLLEIAQVVGAEAEVDPAGDVGGGTARVRTGIAKRSADEIADIVIRSNPDMSELRVGDIARVRVDGPDRDKAYFVGGMPAVSLRVDRSAQGDAIAIQRTVEEVAAGMQATLPEGVRIDLIRTRAEAISDRLKILLDNGLLGLALVVGLLFMFLNARTAFWVAAGIPVAMLATVAMMYAFGLTLNMVSLFALIITLGIVVDDAIVVGEHADFRARRLGEAPVVAAENAARRMAAPVFSATLTTVIAFFALVSIGGRFGDLIADIPFTVIVVLTASLIECFLILPNHMSHALAHSAKEHWYDLPSRVVNRGFSWFRRVVFRRLIALVIRLRYPILAGVVLVLASQVVLLIRGDVPWRFFNAPERGSVSADFAMVNGATRADTMEMMRTLQEATEALGRRNEEEHGRNPVAYALAQVGGNTGRGLAGADTKDADLLGGLAIELIDADLRPYSSFEFVAALEDSTARHPLLESLSFQRWHSGPGGSNLEVQIYGADSATLKQAAVALKSMMGRFPEVSGLVDDLLYDKEELILDLTPQGQALGFTIDGLGRVLRHRLNGIEAATYPEGPRSAEIRVEMPEGELTADFLTRSMMRTPGGTYVPLADIVTVTSQSGFSTIRRNKGLRVVTVDGSISEDDPRRAAEVQEALRDTVLPAIERDFGVATMMSGLAEQESEFLADARTGFILCLIGIYLVLAWIFASWTRPAVIMAIIPFGLVGAVWGHYVWDVPLSMFSVVGLIGMTGIIINDSIVLVTTVDDYARNRGLIPAIIDATADRLRPVLLTTLTTVLGLAPLLYESSQQAQFLKPTVITLCYGLGFGLVLVLLVVPSLLAVQLDLKRQRLALVRLLRAQGVPRAPRLLVAGAGAGALALFAGTLGAVLTTGALPGPLAGLAGQASPVIGALMVYLAGLAALCLLAYGLALAAGAWRRRDHSAGQP
ncbi:acriflavine resistance protein B [Maritimibacter sp. 55A14]|uniref:efflux RND transporter permease subunit n=1 Tax=Maritimibacter sp. 55A14 TaxID=2174844 RepID=UPI000D61AE27|nr:efflux RND transporter permease subunit [Maritimibacter sp. 55A14]PWE32308.1 acriflavine resistance protein B [Maritimibacter sp. 55A14]